MESNNEIIEIKKDLEDINQDIKEIKTDIKSLIEFKGKILGAVVAASSLISFFSGLIHDLVFKK